MPKFKDREEYERWKRERLGSRESLRLPQRGEEGPAAPPGRTENRESPEGNGLRPIGRLFENSWEIFKNRLGTLVSLYLLSAAFLIAVMGISVGLGYGLSLFLPGHKNVMIAGAALIGMVPASISMFWCMAALTFAVSDESLGIKDALGKGWGKIFSFIWLYSLMGFIVTGGFLLFLIPGVIFLVWFSFAQFVFVSEGEKGMNALLKSREYVRDKWFDVFLRLFLVWILGGAVGMVPVLGPILSILFFPFMMIFTYLVYYDLRLSAGIGFAFPDSLRNKFKWIGVGALGYLFLPILIMGIFGASLTIPLLFFKSMIPSSDRTVEMRPMEIPPWGIEPGNQNSSPLTPAGPGTPHWMESEKPGTGRALVIRDGIEETYLLKTGLLSETRLADPERAQIEFQFPPEEYGNARRIKIIVDATREGRHLVDGKAISGRLSGSRNKTVDRQPPGEESTVFEFIADGGQIFPPKDFCTVTITSPYRGTPEGKFAGEVKYCTVHSAGIDHLISVRFSITGVPSR